MEAPLYATGGSPEPLSERGRAVGRWTERALLALPLLFAASATLSYLWVAVQTVDFPYPLEWMEGGVVETVERLLEGRDLYPQPGLDYVGYIYPPFYYWVSGAFSAVMGVDFYALRLVSLLATLGTGALIFAFISRESGSRRWALLGVGLYFATYALGGRWFHIARVDSLYLLLVVGASYGLRFGASTRAAVITGLLMAAAVLTKQTAPLALLPVGLAALVLAPRRALVAGAVGVGVAGVGLLILNAASDGWFFYYLFTVPSAHDLVDSRYVTFWTEDLGPLGVGLGAALLALGVLVARAPRVGLFYLALLLGLVGSAWLARLHNGGWTNVIIPVFAAVAIIAPVGLARLEAGAAPGERRRLGGSPTAVGLALLMAFQLAQLEWSVARSIPSDQAQARGDRFLTYLAGLPGDVLLPDWRWLPQFADKRSYGLGMASEDVRRMARPDDPGRAHLEAELRAAFASRRFSHILLTDRHHPLLPLMGPHYRYQHTIDMLDPLISGATVLPRVVYVPR